MFHKNRFFDKTKNKQRRSIKWFFIKFHKKLNGFKLEHIHPEKCNFLTSGGVQYIGEYHEYIGGFSVHRGDIMSTSGGISSVHRGEYHQYIGGYHDYIGRYHEHIGVCSVHRGFQKVFTNLLPHMHHDIPRCTEYPLMH